MNWVLNFNKWCINFGGGWVIVLIRIYSGDPYIKCHCNDGQICHPGNSTVMRLGCCGNDGLISCIVLFSLRLTRREKYFEILFWVSHLLDSSTNTLWHKYEDPKTQKRRYTILVSHFPLLIHLCHLWDNWLKHQRENTYLTFLFYMLMGKKYDLRDRFIFL